MVRKRAVARPVPRIQNFRRLVGPINVGYAHFHRFDIVQLQDINKAGICLWYELAIEADHAGRDCNWGVTTLVGIVAPLMLHI